MSELNRSFLTVHKSEPSWALPGGIVEFKSGTRGIPRGTILYNPRINDLRLVNYIFSYSDIYLSVSPNMGNTSSRHWNAGDIVFICKPSTF